VGGTKEILVDVRVIATTKVSLETLVAEGRFRDDLFYRLRGLEIPLPPLRARGDDVVLLAQAFLHQFCENRDGEVQWSPESLKRIRAYSWPGNVRELRRVVETLAIVCDGKTINEADLPPFLRREVKQGVERLYTLHLENAEAVPFVELLHSVEAAVFEWALQKASGQQQQAASLLGLVRTTFQSKLAKHAVHEEA